MRSVVPELRQGALAFVTGLLTWTLAPLALGWQPAVITSGSMAPIVQAGDVVVTTPVSVRQARSITTGTVIMIDQPDGRVLHRVIKIRENGDYVTKGDANRVADSTPVPPERVDGKAQLRIPLIGLPTLWLRDRNAPPLIGLTVVALILAAPGRRAVTRQPSTAAAQVRPKRGSMHRR